MTTQPKKLKTLPKPYQFGKAYKYMYDNILRINKMKSLPLLPLLGKLPLMCARAYVQE